MFEIYKRGQGTTARWVAAGGLGGLAAFGCYELQDYLSGYNFAAGTLPLGFIDISVSVIISAVSFAVAAVVIATILNHKRFVDYLIMSETELRKVSWPTRAELKRQTAVVIVTILLFGAVLLVADLVFAYGSSRLYGF